MNGRFVLKASDEQFLFNLKAGNNEVILTSERYTAKASAPGGIDAVRQCAGRCAVPAARVDHQGAVLRAACGQ
jgi:uncharacterized protein YegP (UPF0339 family)